MAYAIVVNELGGPDQLKWQDVGAPVAPKDGEVLVRNTAIGVNFLDVYFRSGSYPVANKPFVPGAEAAGIVDAVGADVNGFNVGDRVAYTTSLGAYAEYSVVPASRVVLLPEFIDDKLAAASLLKGMTAEYLLHRTYRVKPGDRVLIHAAVGGVGQLLCQWAKYLGAEVIGTVGETEKVQLAKELGCDQVLINKQPFAAQVRDLTKGQGVQVVYDGIGKNTFMESLDCLAPCGLMACYGSASGPVPSLDTSILAAKGSLFLTRPTLFTYTDKRADLDHSAKQLFNAIKTGIIQITVGQIYALKDAAQAHKDLEARKTKGSTLLMPNN